ncbi:MAG TPA: LPS export ABC transporter permease LptF, partial [Candidatus Tenderia electrophaga]|nr:LPS export ABC transporter permease LptF [Candidatus Tenderia electrophaga]
MIIERYLFKELAGTLFAVTTVLFLIFVSSWFARLLGQVASGSVQADVIFLLLSLKSVDALMLLLPLSFYLAVLLAFGRLYKDSEMTAMLACGVSLMRITRLVFLMGLGFALIVASVSLYFGPLAKNERHMLQKKMSSSSGLEVIAAGQFRAMGDGDVVFYAERLSNDGKRMENVFIQTERQGEVNLVVAESGSQTLESDGSRYLLLQNGHRYEGEPGQADFRIIKFREHKVLVKQPEAVFKVDSVVAKPSLVLWQSGRPHELAELQWRISMPLSAVLLAVLAVFLSRSNPRQGRYAKLFLGILVYIVYSNLL